MSYLVLQHLGHIIFTIGAYYEPILEIVVDVELKPARADPREGSLSDTGKGTLYGFKFISKSTCLKAVG